MENAKIKERKNMLEILKKERSREKIRLYQRKWNEQNPEKVRLYAKRTREKHREEIKKKRHERYWANPEHARLETRKWAEKNKGKIQKKNKKYCQTHKKERREKQRSLKYRIWRRKNQNLRRKTDPKFHLNGVMGVVIGDNLRGRKAGRKWEILVGYTVEELMRHLENQFDKMMNWNNYGPYWVIDHIKPKSLFHFTSAEDPEFKKCWALENLQPLEKRANMAKSDKY